MEFRNASESSSAMSGLGPRTFEGFGDLPGKAGRINVMGWFLLIAEITCFMNGVIHASQA